MLSFVTTTKKKSIKQRSGVHRMAPNNTELTSVANDIDKNNVESNDQVDEQVSQLKDWEAPKAQGLYDPQNEHEACGVGFIVAIDGRRNHKVRRLWSLFLLLSR